MEYEERVNKIFQERSIFEYISAKIAFSTGEMNKTLGDMLYFILDYDGSEYEEFNSYIIPIEASKRSFAIDLNSQYQILYAIGDILKNKLGTNITKLDEIPMDIFETDPKLLELRTKLEKNLKETKTNVLSYILKQIQQIDPKNYSGYNESQIYSIITGINFETIADSGILRLYYGNNREIIEISKKFFDNYNKEWHLYENLIEKILEEQRTKKGPKKH